MKKTFVWICCAFALCISSLLIGVGYTVLAQAILDQPITPTNFYPVSATSTMTAPEQEQAVYQKNEIDKMIEQQKVTNQLLVEIYQKL